MEAFRRFVKSWFGKALLVLFTIPFAFLGVESYFMSSHAPEGGTSVNGQVITKEAVDAEVDALKKNYVQMVAGDETLLNQEFIEKTALDNLISRQLLLQQAQELGISLGEDQIKQMIAHAAPFQENGKFSQALYEAYLRNTHQTNQTFVESLRQDQALQMLITSLTTGVVSDNDIAQILRLNNEQRQVHLAEISLSSYKQDITVSDQEIQSYYDRHKSQFIDLAKVDVEYIVVSPTQIKVQPQEGVSADQAVADVLAKINENVVASDSLQLVAQEVQGAKVEVVQGFTALSQHPILGQAVVKSKLFDAAVKSGEYRVSSSVQLPSGEVVWAKVNKYVPAGVQQLDVVKDKVKERVIVEKAGNLAKEKIQQNLETFKTLPAKQAVANVGLRFENVGSFIRGENQKLVPQIQNLAFSLAIPKSEHWSIGTTVLNDSLWVVGVSDVKQAENDAKLAEELRVFYTQFRSNQEVSDYLEYLRSESKIK